ncbi:RagB/SusD family nutrient uptake outer membrane protein [Pararcticibacter amylolyticus]|uniref:RagB/SusD family nutrient uptake outer membrane protein n=1 Tax=Pararcticibacter amylolyticus TaxID=2173175 RepID=A0A2U2PCY7_9SPHI|nr:RagB/SusD family nutrient uptake outer membrane protein [Pararcticibacter amylolyticus]PWG79220.1 RagB/SusD family nutrient uptake outer membrane protein [Pararcticibacter amylolyticus]
MKTIKLLLLCISILCASACKKDFLQRDVGVQMTLDEVFANPLQASRYADNTYTFSLNDYGRLNGYKGMVSEFTDESITNAIQAEITPMNQGNFLDPGATDVTSIYTQMYKGIRNANVVLANLDKTPWTSEYNANYIRGEQLYLRAYFYSELIKRYGGVVLLTEPQSFTEAASDPERSSFDETLARILSDLDEAITLLPQTNNDWPNPAAQANRATGAAALALKTRMLMLAASPLWNTSNDVSRWQKAADAARAIMNMNRFSLEPSYANVLQVSTSNEYIRIWPRAPRSYIGTYISDFLVPTSYGGAQSNMSVTQNHVNLYEMNNGKPITDPASGYDPQKPYTNRDPRFYVNILYNGATWQGRAVQTWQTAPNSSGSVTYGTDINASSTFTKTSYYLKRLWPETAKAGSTASALLNFVFYRYAEVLLNFAESQNEATGPGTEVYNAVDAVRLRAGMPKLPEGLSQAQMRDRIRNERAVEFAFEDMRWWDILRWKKGPEIVAQPMKAILVVKNADGSFTYTQTDLPAYQKVFTDRMYLYPIPQNEMNKTAGKLQQNPGW